jgi:PAS domain S-box-containing protein
LAGGTPAQSFWQVRPELQSTFFSEAAELAMLTCRPETLVVEDAGRALWLEAQFFVVGPDLCLQLRDVSAAHQARQELARLTEILGESADCIKVLDLDARLLSMNLGGQQVMEIDDFDVCRGLLWPEFWDGDARLQIEAALERARAGERSVFEAQANTFKGTLKWWAVKVSPLRNAQGEVVNLLAISRDVTARKQAELDLTALNAGLERRVETRTHELVRALQHAQALTSLGDTLHQAQASPEEVASQALAQIGPVLGATSMLMVRLGGEETGLPVIWGETPDVVQDYLTRPGLRLSDTQILRQVAAARRGTYLRNGERESENFSAFPTLPLAFGAEPLCTPDGQVQGFLLAWRPLEQGAWLASEQTLMRRVADTLGLALERADRLQQQTAQGQQLAQSNLELQREQTFLRAVLESMSEGVVVCDEHGQLTLFNSATRRFHGLDTSSLPPEEWASHYALFSGDRESPLSAQQVPLHRAWKGEQVRDAEMVIRADDQPARHLLASGRPMYASGGELLGAVISMRDVTTARKAQRQLSSSNAQLLTSNAELLAANQELEAFAYSASHDLRTPVRHIKSFAELAKMALVSVPNETASWHLERVGTAAERMSALVDALLGLSRSIRQPLTHRPVDLNLLLDQARRDVAPELVDRQVQWQVTPLPVVMGDPATLQQVFTNLLANAVKFSRPREVAIIEVWAQPQDEGWTVSVRDNGVGFNPAYQDKLFGVFQRLHTDREFEGTGVGLAIVRRVVLRHGGQVSAQGLQDGGATFSFWLPG